MRRVGHLIPLVATCLLVAAGCGSNAPSKSPCANVTCGDVCCEAGQVCQDGACTTPSTCTPESREAYCARMAQAGKVCGRVADKDNCGADRAEDCGLDACPSGSCNSDNTCVGCTKETKAAFCARQAQAGKVCGSITARDANCTTEDHTEDCGTDSCPSGRCNSDNTCVGCTKETKAAFCARQAQAGKVCGSITARDANCMTEDHTEDCGTDSCPSGSCDADNTCAACTDETKAAFCARQALAGLACGSITAKDANCVAVDHTEDCGTSACESWQSCDANNHCACTPELDTAFCARMAQAGKVCGEVVDLDNCHQSRTMDCGVSACESWQSCDTTNHCACTPESDTAFCARMAAQAGKECGDITDVDNCQQSRTESCGTSACAAYEFCDTNNNQCSCTPEAETAFCARQAQAGRVCGEIADLDACQQLRTIDCGAAACVHGQQCDSSNTCAVANDTCSAPKPLALTGTPASASVSFETAGATHGASGSCGTMDGPEVVYTFEIPAGQTKRVVAKVTTGDAGYVPAVYLRSACTSTATADEVACSVGRAGFQAVATAASLTAGTYYVFVDGAGASSGSFTLTVTLETALNDTCSNPAELDVSGLDADLNGTVVIHADTSNATDDASGSCYRSGGGGKDLVYAFDIPAGKTKNLTATMVFNPAGSRYPGLILRRNCTSSASADEAMCGYAGSSSLLTASARLLPAGRYYLFADSGWGSGDYGTFDLTVSFATPPPIPPNDTCGFAGKLAIELALDATALAGNTSAGVGDYGSSMSSSSGSTCYSALSSAAASGYDVVYSYTPTAAGDFWVELVPSGWTGVLWYTADTCGDTGANCLGAKKGSSAGAAVDLRITGVANTTYYIYVDSTSASASGPFTIALQSPQANDRCGTGAVPLALNEPVSGDTAKAGADDGAFASGTACHLDLSNSTASGADLVYSYTPAQDGEFDVILRPSGWTGTLWYTTGLCGDATASNCVHARKGSSSGYPVLMRIPGEASRTYFIYVDSTSSTDNGTYGIAIVPAVPLPNDTCGALGANATALTLDAPPVAGNTADATGDYGATLASACNTALGGNAPGPELVYSYTPIADGDFLVDVSPFVDFTWDASYWTAYVWVTAGDTCGDGSACIAAGKSVASGSEVGVRVAGTAATTYFVHVDSSAAGTFGPFTVGIKSPPANDACGAAGENATVLQLDGTPVAGNLGLARADYGGSMASGQTCYSDLSSSAAPGPDLVFAYTPAADGDFWVQMVPFGWNGAVWYTVNACGDAGPGCVHAKKNTNKNGSVDLKITGVANSTYFIYVDQTSTSSAVGAFTIAIKSPAANHACGGVTALALNTPVVGSTAMGAADHGGSMSGTACYSDLSSSSASGAELVYSYTPVASGDFKVEMVPDGWSSNYNALWYNLGTCGGTGSDCVHAHKSSSTGQMSILKIAGLAGTTYYIYADSTSSSGSGYFTISVQPVVVPTNDTCGANGANAIELFLDAAPTAGDLTDANADYECDGSSPYVSNGSPGNDVVFKYTPTSSGLFFVQMRGERFDAVVWMSTNCDSTSASTCAAFGDIYAASGPDTMVVDGAAGTTYYLFADDYNSGSVGGPFTIAVKSAPTLPY